ncbi:MAG: carboxypeptidase-like regulatory domain-containing protein, partial [Patescibacteria group bacterium]
MNAKTQVDGTTSFGGSVLNHVNLTVTTTGSNTDLVVTTTQLSYDSSANALTVEGMNMFSAIGLRFRFIVTASTTDVSSNGINTSGSANQFFGTVENSATTYGSFGDMGMFGPPTAGTSTVGGEFKPQGFGSFTAEQFAFGQADMAFPFNMTAGADANVFQVRFNPGSALQNGDQVAITFPDGTTVTNAALDTLSPFYVDMNEFGSGTVTGSAITVDSAARKVTVTLGVSGTPGTNDSYTIDMRKITNPSIPKGPDTAGYTVTIKVIRAGQTLVSKTSMPYFILEGGTNTLNVSVVAGTNSTTPDNGANGTVYLFGGGPAGPMDKTLTLTNGVISAVDGSSGKRVQYKSLSDGCYFLNSDSYATLGSNSYFGQLVSEPVCLSGGSTVTSTITLTRNSGSSSVTTTVRLSGISNFAGADIDIFAGGPGSFVVRTLTGVTTTPAAGYDIFLPANGVWYVGVGPAMPKGASASKPKSLPGVPPAPVELLVSGIGGGTRAVTTGFGQLPSGASFNDSTDVLTFTFAAADKTVSGTVKDASGNALANVGVFMHQSGFGAPVFTDTNASGTFSLAVSDYGLYEIGVFSDGLPPVNKSVEVRADGSDAGTDPDVFFGGKQVTGGGGSNAFVLCVRKPSYTISGKILDSSGNGISYAPVFGSNASNGDVVYGQSGSDGSYSLFVDAGTWNIRSDLPPDKTDACGTFTKTVTVTTESKSSQNVSPSVSTCYEISGTVSVGGNVLANVPVFVDEWNTQANAPVPGGFKKGSSTNSSGAYTVKVPGSKNYRVGTWHTDYGELSTEVTVASANATGNLTIAATATTTFAFTGGTSDMSAFIQLTDSSNIKKQVTKSASSLASSATLQTRSDATYAYFVDVHGFNKFSGTVSAGSTVTLNVGTSNYITVTGTIKDASGGALSGALVTFMNSSTDVYVTDLTDSNGIYSAKVKAGTYEVSADLSGYVAGQIPTIASFTASTTGYDFGGSAPDQVALSPANRTISGTITNSSGSPMTDGFVWAENANGIVVTAAIDPEDGTYSLGVTTGTWSITAVGPQSAETV